MGDFGEQQNPRSAAAWIERVRALESQGELIRAYDMAVQGLAEHREDLRLKYRAVLALARAGDRETAKTRYLEYGLDAPDLDQLSPLDPALAEDIAALAARLRKDEALALPEPDRSRLAGDAAVAYEQIYRRTKGYFPGINAATLHLIAGDATAAHRLARNVLEALDGADGNAADSYWRAATLAEARLILGHVNEARQALDDAAVSAAGDLGALAVTRRQLRRICHATGCDETVLQPIAARPVLHFCGHIIAGPGREGRFPAEREAEANSHIREFVRSTRPAQAYGALAAGADILFAEAILDAAAELNAVLPFEIGDFIAQSVRPAGEAWVARFHRCLEQAASVRLAIDDEYLGDDQLFAYGSRFAMGLALLRGRYLDAPAVQAALWDGAPARGGAGTAIDVAVWQRTGRPQTILRCDGWPPPSDDTDRPAAPARDGRVNRAILFGDVKGFSRLPDRLMRLFVDRVLGRMADILAARSDDLVFRNTWGDGLFLVFRDPLDAAACALELQDAIPEVVAGSRELDGVGLRLGLHYGPVFEHRDPVIDRINAFGAHVSRAARIEPITPEGSVYVTEHFAAAMALDPDRRFDCDYVGTVPLAKSFGGLPMYLLRAA